MKRVALSLIALSMFCASAHSQESDDPVHHVKDGRMSLRIHTGPPLVLQHGINAIDKVATFNCKSVDGCAFTIHGLGISSSNGVQISVLVDGIAAKPRIYVNEASFTVLQSATVGQGEHTIQAQASSPGNGGDEIWDWEFQYTMYELTH